MGKTINIDLVGAQRILDGLKPGQFPNEDRLCTFVADEYNKKVGTPHINGQLIKIRIRDVNPDRKLNLHFPMPKGKRGRQPGVALTADQKSKMQAGRKNITNNDTNWEKEMNKRWAHREKLLNGILKRSRAAMMKAKCLDCCCDHKDDLANTRIRDCTVSGCVLYDIRPYQGKNNKAEEDNHG